MFMYYGESIILRIIFCMLDICLIDLQSFYRDQNKYSIINFKCLCLQGCHSAEVLSHGEARHPEMLLRYDWTFN